ncbi:hypothetical protein [Jiella sp. M17.18]|uniref:hypothetical protein n=1 Tax=Jiella sp. M17.18 TaxID=3234247 RepID=UPI0034DFBF4B
MDRPAIPHVPRGAEFLRPLDPGDCARRKADSALQADAVAWRYPARADSRLSKVAAAIFGWVFAGEALSGWQIGGGGLILCGIFLARPKRAAVEPGGSAVETLPHR